MLYIILFDGECNICNRYVQFVIRHDKKDLYRFTSLQTKFGAEVMEKSKIKPRNYSTIILLKGEKAYTRSSAVLRIAGNMGGFYKLAFILLLVPKPVRDFFYNVFAKYRHKIKGGSENCTMPENSINEKFIHID